MALCDPARVDSPPGPLLAVLRRSALAADRRDVR